MSVISWVSAVEGCPLSGVPLYTYIQPSLLFLLLSPLPTLSSSVPSLLPSLSSRFLFVPSLLPPPLLCYLSPSFTSPPPLPPPSLPLLLFLTTVHHVMLDLPLRREKSTVSAGYLSIELNDLHIQLPANSLTSANGRQPGVTSGNTTENGPVSDSAVANLADEVNLIDMNTPEMERRNRPQGPSAVSNGREQASGTTGGSVEERTEPPTSSAAAQGVALVGLATVAASTAAGSRTPTPALTPSTSHPLTQPRHSPAPSPSPTPSPTPPQASFLIHNIYMTTLFYSGTPLNGHPSTVDTTGRFQSFDCAFIHFNA